MVPPAGDGGSPAPIDRPILEFLQTRLQATNQVEQATITDASGHLELHISFASPYYPAIVDEATLTVRWYTNDDFKIHYREVHPGAPESAGGTATRTPIIRETIFIPRRPSRRLAMTPRGRPTTATY